MKIESLTQSIEGLLRAIGLRVFMSSPLIQVEAETGESGLTASHVVMMASD